MATNNICLRCGRPLKPGTLQGLCPECLLERAVSLAENGTSAASPFVGFVPPSVEELAKHFPQFDEFQFVGRGGMGAVYRARQKNLDRIVALKILPPAAGRDPVFAERFEREAKAQAKLHHPNIVTVFDSGQAGDYCYFVMEWVDGGSLRDKIRSCQLTPPDALALVLQICDALQFAHDQGVIHRDIKPENILLDSQGRVKVADFGIAKLLNRSPAHVSLTGSKQSPGTPWYMAPEQLQNPEAVDHRADIYSLGVVLYEMLTREVPIGPFDPPSQTIGVDARLDQIVLRAVAKKPERRYQQVSEFKKDLCKVTTGGIVQLPTELGSSVGSSLGNESHEEASQTVLADNAALYRRKNPSRQAVISRRAWLVAAGASSLFCTAWWLWRRSDGVRPAEDNLEPRLAVMWKRLLVLRSEPDSATRSQRLESLLKESIPLVRELDTQVSAWQLLGEISLDLNANWYAQVAALRIVEMAGFPPKHSHLNTLVRRIQKQGCLSTIAVQRVLSGALDSQFEVNKGGKSGFIDRNGVLIIATDYDDCYTLTEGFRAVRLKEKWGFIDRTGKQLVEPKYEEVHPFSDGLAAVKTKEKWGFIDRSGKLIINHSFEAANTFKQGFAAVKVGNKWGFIDNSGGIVAPPKFDHVADEFPDEGVMTVSMKDSDGTPRYGLVDYSGKIVAEPKYFELGEEFFEGLLRVESYGGEWGLIDRKGTVVVSSRFKHVKCLGGGLVAVSNGEFHYSGPWSVFDLSNGAPIAKELQGARGFSEGLLPVQKDEKWGFIDRKGKWIVEPQYDYADAFHEGRALVQAATKWGYLDRTGSPVVSLRFDSAMHFSEGLAAVLVGKKWGFIDPAGKIVIDPKYPHNPRNASPPEFPAAFHNGLSIVGLGTGWTVIDRRGREIVPPLTGPAPYRIDTVFRVGYSDKEGWLDWAGEWLWKPTE